MTMLIKNLRGAPALSEFRVKKLLAQCETQQLPVTDIYAEYAHFAQLNDELTTEEDNVRVNWNEALAKARPKRLKVVKAKTAADRFKAATAKPQGGSGKVMKNESAQEKAQAIFDLLIEEKVIR